MPRKTSDADVLPLFAGSSELNPSNSEESARAKPPASNPYLLIFEWSKGQPLWLRDALRRVIESPNFSENDVKEVAENFLREVGVHSGEPEVQSLDEDYLPASAGETKSVSLTSLHHTQGVNRLHSDQKLEFAPGPSLNIVYGENGTGKSGYARILKSVSQARSGLPKILGNRFSNDPPEAKARITYDFGGDRQKFRWRIGSPVDRELRNISFFDSDCAYAHACKDGTAAFAPAGLDVLPSLIKLIAAVETICSQLQDARMQAANSYKSRFRLLDGTSVGRALDNITANTDLKQIAHLATLSKQEQGVLAKSKKLVQEAVELNSSSGQYRASLRRLRHLKDAVSFLQHALTEDLSSAAASLVEAQQKARQAVKAASMLLAETARTEAIGNDTWRELWRYAQQYALEANLSFPHAHEHESGYCPLCEQPLTDEAVKRLKTFDAFVEGQAQQSLVAAQHSLSSFKAKLKDVKVPLEQLDSCSEELQTKPELVDKAALRRELNASKEYLDSLIAWTEHQMGPTPSQPASVESSCIDDIIEAYQSQLVELEHTSNPEELEQRKNQVKELEAREKLKTLLDEVRHYQEQLKAEAAYKECLKRLPKLKKKASEQALLVHSTFVSQSFREAFEREVDQFQLRHLRPELRSKARKGETRLSISLDGHNSVEVDGVASEGEVRVLAIASFLAELSQSTHMSTIVVDDPVSSLSEKYRVRVARRLVEESKKRQVIVFTHDAAFNSNIRDEAERQDQERHVSSLRCEGGMAGVVSKNRLWDFMRVDERVEELKKRLATIEKEWNPLPSPENRKSMGDFYTDFRTTMERVARQTFAGGVVLDAQKEVKVEFLYRIAGVTVEHCKKFKEMYSWVSDIASAHDSSETLPSHVQAPSEAQRDIEQLEALIREVTGAQRAAKGLFKGRKK